MLRLPTPAAVDQVQSRRSRHRQTDDVAVRVDRKWLRRAAGSRSTAAAAAHAPTANGAGDADEDENESDAGSARSSNDDDGHRDWTGDTRRRTTVLPTQRPTNSLYDTFINFPRKLLHGSPAYRSSDAVRCKNTN